jgi:hypothetical protein
LKSVFFSAAIALAALTSAQNLSSVYNRDTGQAFELKSATTTSTVYGAIVKNKTVFTFANPYESLTEASINFSLGQGSVLDGFAYWYKNEYVKGILMDKAKAWFIYTAITSRNRDPGIMEQVSPSSYHAQIYPLAVGFDLRVELTAVEFLKPTPEGWLLPDVPEYHGIKVQRFVNTANRYVQLAYQDGRYEVHKPKLDDVQVFTTAQRGPGGRTYVAGVIYTENQPNAVELTGLRDPHIVQTEGGETSFVGWTRAASSFPITVSGNRVQVPVNVVTEGDETSKLWAHQMLIHHRFKNRKEVLDFSMRYQVPSRFTALLAVPEEEMKLFREKAAEFERKQKEEARRRRAWEEGRRLNADKSQGGDPEIRIAFDNCVSAYAKLPDGRVIQLKPTGQNIWGGNFEIPAEAPEGNYIVRVYAMMRDGTVKTEDIRYTVDRTPPKGVLAVKKVNGVAIISVRSEPGLDRVTAYFPDGRELRLKEGEPGVYSVALPPGTQGGLLLVLMDSAHNRTELTCSLP